MKKLFLFCCLFYFHSAFLSAQFLPSTIDPKLSHQIALKGNAPALIIMREQADLGGVRFIHGKTEKGTFVFEKLTQTATKSQIGVKQILAQHQASFRSFWVVNAVSVDNMTTTLLDVLATEPTIESIVYNAPMTYHKPIKEGAVNGKITAVEWGVNAIKAPDVWQMGFRGQGVVVGGQDTGYDWEHPAIKAKYRGWDGSSSDHNYNWHDAIHVPDSHNSDTLNPCGYSSLVPCDDDEHGTHTMGTMIGADGTDEIGVAPDAKWIGVRNMERGYGKPSTYIEAFEWFLAPTDLNNANPDPAKAPHVINNSWGCTQTEGCDPSNFGIMELAVNNVKAAGIVVVVSAGNSGSNCSTIEDPAAIFQNSYSIGATSPFNTIANFSSRGPVTIDGSNRMKPDVSAPGVFIRSCVPGGGYTALSGTSMAGPHVAGAVAVLISAKPSLAGQVDSIEYILSHTATPMTTNNGCGGDSPTDVPNNTFGYGIINLLDAVNFALGNPSSIPSSPQINVSLYPNPAKNEVMISTTSDTQTGVITFFAADGRAVLHTSFQHATPISLSELAAGTYFYQVLVGEHSISGAIQKE